MGGHTLTAQQYSYTHYGTKDGLAGSTVYGISQDRDGFIWFGTETGLSRFDGTHFTNFTIIDGLPSNEILGVFTDSKNRVWMSCLKNAICYYYKGKIYNSDNDAVLRRIKLKNRISCIAENETGDILIKGIADSFIIKTGGAVLDCGKANHSIPFKSIGGIGSLQICQSDIPDHIRKQMKPDYAVANGPFAFDKSKRITYFTCRPIDAVGEVRASSDTVVFFETPDALAYTIKLPSGMRFIAPLNKEAFAALGPYGGVGLYDIKKRSFDIYLKDYTIQYVIEDSEGNLWFSTKGSGVLKLSRIRFKNYIFDNQGIRNITKIENKIYIGTDNGHLWQMPSIKDMDFKLASGHPAVKVTTNFDMFEKHMPLGFISFSGSDFLHYFHGKVLSAVKTAQIYNDTLLVASSAECFLFKLSAQKKLNTIYTGRTTCAYKLNSVYYIGTLNGLYKIVPGQPARVIGANSAIGKSQISQIAEGKDGILWISTYERGVMGYKDDKVVVTFNQKNGLTSDICRCLFAAGDYLWVGTDKGLNKIDCRPGHYRIITTVTEADGLSSSEIYTVFCDSNYVYVGCPLGMTVFDERRFPLHSISNILFTSVFVSGRPQPLFSKHLLSEHKDNNIRFDYAGISFLSSGNIVYEYKLEGLNTQWQYTKDTRLIYPSLPSGKYTLLLRAINKFGDKSDILQYGFEIKKNLWEEVWFRITGLFLVIFFTFVIVRYVITITHKKEKEKLLTSHKIIELEHMALRAQMNPHFIFNCLNSMQQYIINQDVKKANFYLSRFAALVRQTLDNSATVNITLSEEISYLRNYLELESLQLSGKLLYEIIVDGAIDLQTRQIPNMVLQPYIENAVRHGISRIPGTGYIKIRFAIDETDNFLVCTIEDNGPGIAHVERNRHQRNPKHTSQGMSITDKRIHTLNQLNGNGRNIVIHILDLSSVAKGKSGTQVILKFPL